MTSSSFIGKLEGAFAIVRRIILAFAILSGVSILVMIGVTVVDIILRIFNTGIVGAYDIVRICGVITISCGLPYITAVKGHIAIEFFYQNFSRAGRVALDTCFRIVAIVLFAMLFYKNIQYGISLKASGELMPTLSLPVYWIPFLISLNSLLVCIVVLFHMLHPGKEMIKP